MTLPFSDIGERAAILQYDAGLSREEAEKRAVGEALGTLPTQPTKGILDELRRAARKLSNPELAEAVQHAGLSGGRCPQWGFDHIVIENDTYRPANNQEFGKAALIVPATEDGRVIDLIATTLGTLETVTRLGVAKVIGADAVTAARDAGEPLRVFKTPFGWLRGGTLGAVTVDWRHAAEHLDGVRDIHCNADLAPRIHAATRSCWPVPRIVTLRTRKAHRAA